MRKWGLVVSLCYAAVLTLLLFPLGIALIGAWKGFADVHSHIIEAYGYLATWITLAVFVFGEVLLLALSVDLTQRRLKPRTHITISAVIAGLFLSVLTAATVLDIALAVRGDRIDDWAASLLRWAPLVLWVVWGVAFYRYSSSPDDALARAVKWLLRGSVLELLIAVPSHVIVRRRDDCCAPIGTSFGITSGLAIMLLAFGPSVLFLYKKRMGELKSKRAAA